MRNKQEKKIPLGVFAFSRFSPFPVPLQIVKEHGAGLEGPAP
jgi:hypothetical protein